MRRKATLVTLIVGLVCAIAILIVLATGCALVPQRTGSLVVRLNENMTAKSIVPDLPMNVMSYQVSITGAQAYNFTLVKPDATYSIQRMPLGSYSISVSGLNADVFEVAYGSNAFMIEAGATTEVSVTVIPLVGEGSIDLVIGWQPPEIVGIPSVLSTYAPVSTMEFQDISLDYVITPASTSYADIWSNGWYLLTYILEDDLSPVYGMATAVRIVKEEISAGLVELTIDDITGAVGSIDLDIWEDMENPIDISLSGVVENLSEMGSMEVIAEVTETVDFHWFISGSPIAETTNTLTVNGVDLGISNHRIDCIVKATNRLSSAGAAFHVIEDQLVYFPDSEFRGCVEFALLKDLGEDIYLSEVQAITQLSSNGKDVSDMTGIEDFTSLIDLKMTTASITSLAPIAGLTQLEIAHFNVNPIVDTMPLSDLINLIQLEMVGTLLVDLDGIVLACDGGLTGCNVVLPQQTLSDNAKNVQVPYIESCGNTVTLIF